MRKNHSQFQVIAYPSGLISRSAVRSSARSSIIRSWDLDLVPSVAAKSTMSSNAYCSLELSAMQYRAPGLNIVLAGKDKLWSILSNILKVPANRTPSCNDKTRKIISQVSGLVHLVGFGAD